MTDEFRGLEEEWAQAIKNHDTAAADRLLADDFYLSSAIWRDRRIEKATWLDTMVHGVETEDISVHDLEARRFDKVAVVTCRIAWRATWDGEDISDDYLVADVWVERDGRWQVVWRSSARRSGPATEHELARG